METYNNESTGAKLIPKKTRLASAMSHLSKHLMRILLFCIVLLGSTWLYGAEDARTIIENSGIKGGLVVHLNCGDGKLTADLHINNSYHVHGLDTSQENIAKARRHIKSRGLYGAAVSVALWDGKKLPYTGNLVNLLVASGKCQVSSAEINRVLAPRGVAVINGRKTVKPVPPEIDDWSHANYDAKGNTVSKDRRIDYLKNLQWVGSPRFARHHDHMTSMPVAISEKGRVFYIFDEGNSSSILLPSDWKLIARDAFSGVILWKRSIPDWAPRLYPLKAGPVTLKRRLVAQGDKVFATLGIEAPISAIDASTGQTLATYKGTENTEEIIVSGNQVFALIDRVSQRFPLKPKMLRWSEGKRIVAAVDTQTGAVMWKKEQPFVCPLTLAADEEHVVFHDGDKIVALDRETGDRAWASKPVPRLEKMSTNFGPRLAIYKDVIVFVGGENYKLGSKNGQMTCLSAKTGKILWTNKKHPANGYRSPEDMFIIGDNIWAAEVWRGNDTGITYGFDIKTGETAVEFPPDVNAFWFHHRCYPAKATEKYLLLSRTGIEFVNPKTKHWKIHHWTRGSCMFGILPANGMIYTPQHPCACYLGTKTYGFSALSPALPENTVPQKADEKNRLLKGPSYCESLQGKPATADDWPVYRHDPGRSGSTKSEAPAELKQKWSVKAGSNLTPPIVVGNTVYLADKDSHEVHALDGKTGKSKWTFTAGGRIDSAPTYAAGRIVFGCNDGYVYCLDARTGELAWRFRAAPYDRRHMYFEQVESVWPVPGSVLVVNNKVTFIAGRSMFLDGGLRFIRLDLETGEKLLEKIHDDKAPGAKKDLQKKMRGLSMPASLNDVLSYKNKEFFMRTQPFNADGTRTRFPVANMRTLRKDESGPGKHLFSPTGFTDDSWWHRTYWVFGKQWASGHAGYMKAGQYTPAGRILVYNDSHVYGFARKPLMYQWSTPLEYRLFGCPHDPTVKPVKNEKGKRRGKLWAIRYHDWNRYIPFHARAMVLVGDTLFAAGPPDVLNEERAFARIDDPSTRKALDEQLDALAGSKGAELWAVSTADGNVIRKLKMDSIHVFDGMASTRGKLYISMQNGTVICLGK